MIVASDTFGKHLIVPFSVSLIKIEVSGQHRETMQF